MNYLVNFASANKGGEIMDKDTLHYDGIDYTIYYPSKSEEAIDSQEDFGDIFDEYRGSILNIQFDIGDCDSEILKITGRVLQCYQRDCGYVHLICAENDHQVIPFNIIRRIADENDTELYKQKQRRN